MPSCVGPPCESRGRPPPPVALLDARADRQNGTAGRRVCRGSGTFSVLAAAGYSGSLWRRKSDVTVVVLGDSMTTCGEWKDRDSPDVPGTQLSLLRRVSQTATTTVVVLLNGRPTTFGEFDPDGSRTLDQVSSISVGHPGRASRPNGAASRAARSAVQNVCRTSAEPRTTARGRKGRHQNPLLAVETQNP